MAKRIFYTFLDDLSLLTKMLNEDSDKEELWKEFIRRFTKLILKICWQFEKDKDRVMDKYLWVCTKLADNNFAVLRKFNNDNREIKPKFTTWLVAVTRNLCVDEHRSVNGRKQYPKALLKLDKTHLKIFELYFRQGISIDEIVNSTSLDGNTINEIIENIEDNLSSSRESIYNNYQDPYFIPFENDKIGSGVETDVLNDLETLTEQWISRLPEEEKIILRLRFWEGLSAKDIVNILSLENEQKVYTILRKIFKTLRKEAERDIS